MAATDRKAHQASAREYLRGQLGARAPSELRFEASFAECPLSGEGAASLFSFDLNPGPGAAACASRQSDDEIESAPTPESAVHYVVAGETAANYFPSFGLDPDDGYSLHIGTRFMLEMRIARIEVDGERPEARQAMCRTIRETLPGVEIANESLAGLFRSEEQTYAVYRVTLNGEEVYFMGADCPPGFYRLTDHPPQVALRLHFGKLIRAERAEARDGPE